MAKKPPKAPAKPLPKKAAKRAPAAVDELAERRAAKQVAATREKLKKAMEDPEFRERVAKHLQELLRQE